MYEEMHQLDEIIKFFKDEGLYDIDENRIKHMYILISNPHLRVNDSDKQWIAYTSQESEVTSILNEMKDLFGYSRLAWTKEKNNVINAIHQAGTLFLDNDITMKPKIPFFIIVLDKLKD